MFDNDDIVFHLSVWNEKCEFPFLGQLLVPLEKLISENQTVHKWFPLLPLENPNDMSFFMSLRNANSSNSLNRNLGKELVKQIQFKQRKISNYTDHVRNYYFHCKVCNSPIDETPNMCSECFTVTHAECSINTSCGSEGTLLINTFSHLMVYSIY